MFWLYNIIINDITYSNCYNKSHAIFITIVNNNPCKHIHEESDTGHDMKLLEELKRYD